MQRGRLAIIVTLALAVALGTLSAVSIRRAAQRRAALVDDVAARVPVIAGARVLSAWQPAAAGDEAAATYCLDGEAHAGAQLFASALAAAGWSVEALKAEPRAPAVEVHATSGDYGLRAVVRPGTRPDCDGARGQATLTVQAAPR